jgi:hypothetical protein
MPTGPHTVATEGTGAKREIDPGITGGTSADDPLRALLDTVVTADTQVDEACFRTCPRGTNGKAFAMQVAPEKLSPVDRFRHTSPLTYRIGLLHLLCLGSLMWVKRSIGSKQLFYH